MPSFRKTLRLIGHTAFVLTLAAATAWAGTALWVQISPPMVWLFWAALGLASLTALALHWRSPRASWALIAATTLLTLGWYHTIQPSQTRTWAADVQRGITGIINGSRVTLHNLRNFHWTSDTQGIPEWDDVTVNLDQLATVDMITSTWDSPDIAHLLVSFGFTDGQRIAFSVEIRKEQGEKFSTIGGFFRQFELILIAATESDIIRVRTNLRGEDVHLFPVNLNATQRRSLFLSYIDFGNSLAAKPQFYNTVTANCASTVYGLVKVIKPDMPLDSRLLFSGRLPEYIDELGGLPGTLPMALRRKQAAISAKALSITADQDFSNLIRSN